MTVISPCHHCHRLSRPDLHHHNLDHHHTKQAQYYDDLDDELDDDNDDDLDDYLDDDLDVRESSRGNVGTGEARI